MKCNIYLTIPCLSTVLIQMMSPEVRFLLSVSFLFVPHLSIHSHSVLFSDHLTLKDFMKIVNLFDLVPEQLEFSYQRNFRTTRLIKNLIYMSTRMRDSVNNNYFIS